MIKLLAADAIPGMMPGPQLAWFATEASTKDSVVEVGCWRGRTTRALVDNCPGTVFAVDTWEGSPELKEELEFMRQYTGDPEWLFHEFTKNVSGALVLRMPSVEAAKVFPDRSVQMVILDAAHDYYSVCDDIRAWWPKVAIGGILCGHDFNYPDVAKAVREVIQGFPSKGGEDTAIWRVSKTESGVS